MLPSGKALVAGVMGWPVGHSRSPRLHGFWLREYGIDGAYVPLAVPPDRIEQAVRALPALGLRGANVTIPHKEAVVAALDRVEPAARRIGAVNTIVVLPDGTLEGRNTDGFGFIENLRAGAPGWRAVAGPAVVLGAGGAARAILVALADAGAPEIRLLNRTADRADRLADELGGPVRVLPWEARPAALDGAALVVNTTSQGMAGHPPLDIGLGALPPDAVVTDIVYTPLETPLLAAARARGNPVVDGLGMLLHQARPGFEAWFGRRPEVTPALRAFVLETT
ncbi:shikimate dehydrogenase [Arenibaculum pallidiluteum]|uniref:shikimate dehydrogenase n=1 Tax=Arenibaculum pallidiluteum TaxID=2812559 RepID=UPI001A95D030|nr:shikimate dehydrogenase [Arenibaculum pallidiluteum]